MIEPHMIPTPEEIASQPETSRALELGASTGSAKTLPDNVTIDRNEYLGSDERPWTITLDGVRVCGDSPEECATEIAKRLRELDTLKAKLRSLSA